MPEINEIIAKFKEITKTKCIGINTTESKTGPFESSFGGTPYFPKDFEYPYAENFNQRGTQIPMMLLAQINFEEAPHFENFPEKGILQIFINPTDDLYGADFDNPTVQKNYKIFYHADIDKNLENQQKTPIIKDYIDESKGDEIYSPIDTPLKLSFEIQEQYMTCSDYKFDEIFTKLYNEETGSDYEEFFDMPDEITDKVFDEIEENGHRMGGYPFFTQSDPREYDEKSREYSTLLLQIDSEIHNGEFVTLWGDCGVANFFIKPEDLKNCKFDDVVYNWDCG